MNTRCFALGLLVWLGIQAQAQTNPPPVKLAVIGEDPMSSVVRELLTVELSATEGLQLLERDQIKSIYREQSLTAASEDHVELGRILGADGVLVTTLTSEGTNRYISVRLVAVAPGVVIGSVRNAWPLPNITGWSRIVAARFSPLLPKLSVSREDAIPISVVSLHSALRSVDAQELERQLNFRLIERLTAERELFVLERRQMQTLVREKDFEGVAESNFWSGGFLLDGIIDRDGYAESTLSLHVQLRPPRGAPPIKFEVRTARNSIGEAADQIAARLRQDLSVSATVEAWSASAEAEQYAEQAAWALKWEMPDQATEAADAAWALGKHDVECASLRIQAHLLAVANPVEYETIIAPAHQTLTADSRYWADVPKLTISRGKLAYQRRDFRVTLMAMKPPREGEIDQARRLLELYEYLCRAVAAQPREPTDTWYLLGVRVLETAAQVLKRYHLEPELQVAVGEELEDLRSQARRLWSWLSDSPGGGDVVWHGRLGERVESHSSGWVGSSGVRSVEKCKLEWGYLWQDLPEQGLHLYQQPTQYPKLNEWNRKRFLSSYFNGVPQLAGWTDEDRARVPILWSSYLEDLGRVKPPPNWNPATSPAGDGAAWVESSGPSSDNRDSDAFHNQKLFLMYNTPWESGEFDRIFSARDYTPEQARLLQPLLAAYQSNIAVQLGQIESRLRRARGIDSVKLGIKRTALNTAVKSLARLEKALAKVSPPDLRMGTASSVGSPTISAALEGGVRAEVEPGQGHGNAPGSAQSQKGSLRDGEEVDVQSQLEFLRTNNPPDAASFARMFPGDKRYSVAETRELLTLLDAYQSRLETSDRARAGSLEQFLRVSFGKRIEFLRGQLASASPPSQPPPVLVEAPVVSVRSFQALPQARLKRPELYDNNLLVTNEGFGSWSLMASRVRGDQLWLDIRYSHSYSYSFAPSGGGWTSDSRSVCAVLNLSDLSWEFIHYPERERSKRDRGEPVPDLSPYNGDSLPVCVDLGAIDQGALMLTSPLGLHTYDLKTRSWETQRSTWQAPQKLFVLNGHLFLADSVAISELLDGFRQTRVLASRRRNPPQSLLDELDFFGATTLVPGPRDSLQAILGPNIYAWDGADWKSLLILPKYSRNSRVEVGRDGTLVKLDVAGRGHGFWFLPHDRNEPKFLLAEAKGRGANLKAVRATRPDHFPIPTAVWEAPVGAELSTAAALGNETNLCVLVDHSVRSCETDRGGVTTCFAGEMNGRHANLLFFQAGESTPVVVPLNIKPGSVPETGELFRWGKPMAGATFQMPMAGANSQELMSFRLTSKWLILMQANVPGVWMVPRAEIDNVISEAHGTVLTH